MPGIFNNILGILVRLIYFKSKENYYKKYDRSLMRSLPEINKLNSEEKNKILLMWGSKLNYDFLTVCKSISVFDERNLSRTLYMKKVARSLNPQSELILENKSLYSQLFANVNQPQTIVKRISGSYFDDHFNLISSNIAIEKLAKVDKFIIKPVYNSNSGQNVRLIDNYILKEPSIKIKNIQHLISNEYVDFIAQKVIQQNDDISKFNKSSVNTLRVYTLFINEKVTVTKVALRIGQKDSVVDNVGAGGLMVGIHENGDLFEYGFNKYLKKFTKSPSGISFKGNCIVNIKQIRQLAIQCHTLIPSCRFIGWDFAINKEGVPVLIEFNVSYPLITLTQICAGPIFGERTKEVVTFIDNNPPKVSITL